MIPLSENTQSEQVLSGAEHPAGIKSAIMNAPLELLLQDQPRHSREIQKDLNYRINAQNPETLLNAEYYLECADRMHTMASGSDLFLRAGLNPDLASTGIFGKAVVHCETLWDALTTAKDWLSFLSQGDTVSYRLTKGRFQIRYEDPFDGRPGTTSHIEYYIATFLYLLRLTRWTRDPNLTVTLPQGRTSPTPLICEATKRQSAPVGLIEFDDELLRSPMKHANPLLSSIAIGLMARLNAKALKIEDLTQVVTELHFQSITSGSSQLRLTDAAFLLDMPVRTLQARLKATNASFARVRDAALHKLARQELLAGRSLSHTAEKLGFSHRQSFSEAFTKWEGENPSIFASRRHI